MLLCPVCKTRDYVELVYSRHMKEGIEQTSNPTDFDKLYVCERLHVFCEDGTELKSFDRG